MPTISMIVPAEVEVDVLDVLEKISIEDVISFFGEDAILQHIHGDDKDESGT